MNLPYSRPWTAVLLALVVALPPHAEAASPTLPEVIRLGVARYPELVVTQAIRGQSEAIRTQASGLFADDPALIVRHETDAVNSDKGYRQWEGGVAMPLWLPGQRDRRIRVAEATEREADAAQRLHTWQVAGQLREVLWAIRITDEEAALAQNALESAQALQADIDRRYQAGELARTDLILAQKETKAREIELTAAKSVYEAKLMHYEHLTGLTVVPADIREAAASATEIADDHPALRAVRETLARSDANRVQTRAERRANPVLTLGGKSERPEAEIGYDASMFVELNFPLGGTGQAALRNAAAERTYAEAMSEFTRTQLELEHDLHTALAGKELATQSLQLAREQNELAAEGLRLMQRAFELGESDLFALLQTRVQALSAQRDFSVRSLENDRAVARVNQALGVIPE